ncbi:16S rRNA (cytidine(1402)-2'-O)-methyltransferase [uncultured Thermanaerothrix sp.]|uniref:16S rRNA (cytidine(1402)-2'-O)-methyltransferase n=1 Tax=uncultured Thermanaerothrix sp. TaxID=1195149 RepID=UPI00261EBDA4|nr:16S rRNA (cytidine(1402)-2'-O)-methyltransferase [uncultured Thermanaerothrix sp.]
MKQLGTLYIVATPLGHPKDITLRAVEILNQVDGIICEEIRQAKRLLHQLNLPDKPLYPLNEHNEAQQAPMLVSLLQEGQQLALISDCGTPVFSDPGALLIHQAVVMGVTVKPIPGPSSLMAALSVVDMPIEQFVFGGFLPRKPEKRRQALQKLKAIGLPIVLMDAPYRLITLLQEVERLFGSEIPITLALDLTLPQENILRGSLHSVLKTLKTRKAEFVLIIHLLKSK